MGVMPEASRTQRRAERPTEEGAAPYVQGGASALSCSSSVSLLNSPSVPMARRYARLSSLSAQYQSWWRRVSRADDVNSLSVMSMMSV